MLLPSIEKTGRRIRKAESERQNTEYKAIMLVGVFSWIDNKVLKTSKFIKSVSAAVFDMTNAVYHDKPLILIGATFREKLGSYHRAVNEADFCILMRRAGSKPRH